MKLRRLVLLLCFALLSLALSSCATSPIVTAEVAPGGTLLMKADNFSFSPNSISIHGTGTVTLTIANASGTAHNITVDDPKGKVIDSMEIPPNATVTTQVSFPGPGDYPFTCSHPFHAGLGMKGHFIVSGS